jgi:UDP-galactopyranose mutase
MVARTGLSTKDFIAPTSFDFREGKCFKMGRTIGAVSFLQILAPELNDRMLADFLEMDSNITVNFHIRTIDQAKAIKSIKMKITDLDKMKIEEQKKEACITEPKNLEEQAISLVGRDIFEKLIKGYTEKQWGRDCKELPAFIIKRLPVRLTFDNNYFNALYQGIPIGGYTQLVEHLLEGIEVRLNTDYLEQKEALDRLAETVVYTGPIDAYFGYSLGALEYRSVRFETEVLDIPNFQGNAAVTWNGN